MRVFNFRHDRDESDVVYSFLPDFYMTYKYWRILREFQSNNIAAWEKWTNGGRDETLEFDPDVVERLKGLGYVQ